MTNNDSTLQIRDKIIQAALPEVVFDGWQLSTIEQAAEKAGYDDLVVRSIFPDGMVDVLDAVADWADRGMLIALGNLTPDEMRVRDKIETALLTRFEILAPHKEAIAASMKFWINPLHKPRAGKILWRSADRIWQWAGDTATDYNRYTKRSLLCGILGPAMLLWVNDHSEDMSKTRRFIAGRITNIMQVGKFISRFKKSS